MIDSHTWVLTDSFFPFLGPDKELKKRWKRESNQQSPKTATNK